MSTGNNIDGRKLHKALNVNNISITDFAKKMNISRSTAYSYFGTVKLQTHVKQNIKDVFGIDIDDSEYEIESNPGLSKLIDHYKEIINNCNERELKLLSIIDKMTATK